MCQRLRPSHDIVLTVPIPTAIFTDPHGAKRVYALISRVVIGWESLPQSCLPSSSKQVIALALRGPSPTFLLLQFSDTLLTSPRNLYLQPRVTPFFNRYQLLETRSPVSHIHYHLQRHRRKALLLKRRLQTFQVSPHFSSLAA